MNASTWVGKYMLRWARQVGLQAYLAITTDLKEDLRAALYLESWDVEQTQGMAMLLAAKRSVRACLYRS